MFQNGETSEPSMQNRPVRLPTPTANDWKGSGPTIRRKDGKLRGDRLDYATEQRQAIQDAKDALASKQSTLFPEDFPARTYQPLVKVPESLGNAQDFGKKCSESFAKYDPATSLWKTSQLCLDGDLASFLETWPRAGMTCWLLHAIEKEEICQVKQRTGQPQTQI